MDQYHNNTKIIGIEIEHWNKRDSIMMLDVTVAEYRRCKDAKVDN